MDINPRDCLQHSDDCKGPVKIHWMPNANRGFPRCEYHWDKRMENYEGSTEQWAHSDVAPPDFDPTYAGERWDEEY